MHPIDALWHLLNLFAPALGVGLLASALAKLIWRRGLAGVAWRRLALWGVAGAVLATVGALIAFERDGTMAGYALLAAGATLGLWWAGWMRAGG